MLKFERHPRSVQGAGGTAPAQEMTAGSGFLPHRPAVSPSFWRALLLAFAVSLPVDALLAYVGWLLS